MFLKLIFHHLFVIFPRSQQTFFQLGCLLLLLVAAAATLLAVPTHAAPAPAVGSALSGEQLLDKLRNSNATNYCELDQDRKDMCEVCRRDTANFVVTYLGCCQNYDGIYEFCLDYTNFKYKEQKI